MKIAIVGAGAVGCYFGALLVRAGHDVTFLGRKPHVDAINARKTPALSDAREKTCYVVPSELLANKGLTDATYAAAEKTLGLESLVALIATTGSFSMTCMTAGTFQIDPPAVNPTPLAE